MTKISKSLITSLTLDACGENAGPIEIARVAGLAEEAGLDMLVIGGATPGSDSLVVASWLAGEIRHAGLVAVLPALHTFPFHAARALSALDFLSGGHSGWAPTTLGHEAQAPGFGPDSLLTGDAVALKGLDFIEASCALWDTWDADALIIDQERGVYLKPDSVRRIRYKGPYFGVVGPLNAARPPQGYPVLVQSDDDVLWRLTAGRADVLLVQKPDTETLKARRATIASEGGAARLLGVVDLDGEPNATRIVDQLAAWFVAGLIDGVHAVPQGPAQFELFIGGILPELARRGLFAPADGMGTLRARLGFDGPAPPRRRAETQSAVN